jgi:hypothetical protein
VYKDDSLIGHTNGDKYEVSLVYAPVPAGNDTQLLSAEAANQFRSCARCLGYVA